MAKLLEKVMDDFNWEDSEFFEEAGASYTEAKAKTKVKKRKWREIESVKEKRRLKRQLEEFEQYSY